MEFVTTYPSSVSGSSPAAYPRQVNLERHCQRKIINYFDDEPKGFSHETLATARTSGGHPIQVSLRLAEPPATSAVRVKFPVNAFFVDDYVVMATHRDSLLLAVKFNQMNRYHRHPTTDYFVYNAGDAAADPPRPPSLLLLPGYRTGPPPPRRRYPVVPAMAGSDDPVKMRELDAGCTGILQPRRRDGDEEVVVAELKMVETRRQKMGELLLFRSGKWTVARPWIRCDVDSDDEDMDEEFGHLHPEWKTSSVFAVGDRVLCWADETSDDGGGLLICDVLQREFPNLMYLPFPSVPETCLGKKVCVTNGGDTIKFVNIFARCCCGDAGVSDCQHSRHSYTINTWTLRMDMDGRTVEWVMEWVMDGMVDATEFWSLDAYEGLPRIPLSFPVVSMDDPYVIRFSLCESRHVEEGGDPTVWQLMVDMRSKTILSVSHHPDSLDQSSLTSERDTDDDDDYDDDDDDVDDDDDYDERGDGDGTNLMLRSPRKMSTRTEPAAKASDILAAFQELPSYGLALDDTLKAYAILSSDNGRRVTSLLRLPMKMRRDWLLMEIKAVRDA